MIELLKGQLPEFAKDARLNLSKVLDLANADGLTADQIIGVALAVSYHLGNESILRVLHDLTDRDEIDTAAKLAASLMAMTNVYYRFVHLSEQAELGQMPAGLRMQGMMNPGTDKVTFELFCLGVSILNGCGSCISSHTKQLKEHGVSLQGLARVGKIAAVLHAVHVSLNLNLNHAV